MQAPYTAPYLPACAYPMGERDEVSDYIAMNQTMGDERDPLDTVDVRVSVNWDH